MASSPDLLAVTGLGKTFGPGTHRKEVLRDVHFHVGYNDSLAIVGPSGCGKTTLLLMAAGLLPPTTGEIHLEGESIQGPSRKMAVVFQAYGLFPWKRVAENILLGAQFQKLHVSQEALTAIKRELDIENLDHLYPHQLSGGQRQRVALARAMLLRPSLLLLDEPFAALDLITREHLQDHLLILFKKRKFSFVIVTHNIEEAVFLGRRIVIMDPETHGIGEIIDNPNAGTAGFRTAPDYFSKNMTLRHLIEHPHEKQPLA
ncbi:MAG: ATP-binding cassette domain-containing protein [Syntrophobacterales bacterium]|jgi:NitT/TauT family transport system ATP-binding protein|nr:ATP-binding cassette domain-containing protein [Syntrophobacterales bacterium]